MINNLTIKTKHLKILQSKVKIIIAKFFILIFYKRNEWANTNNFML